MPQLLNFSDNPFKSRSDLVRAARALLRPLEPYRSPGRARIKLATGTGAGFSETAAQLEGFARPIWVVPSLLLDRPSTDEPDAGPDLAAWPEGLVGGTDPSSPEYWGDVGDFDQRMVEMESIAFALLTAPQHFVPPERSARDRLAAWLRQINGRRMPENNWRWFRVFVNLALVSALGVDMEEVRGVIERDLALLDSFYLGDGWSSDGLWGEERKQADYYSGSFALQFAQMLYVKLSKGFDEVRADRYSKQAAEFASGFWRYFDIDGAAIPFGRSLTYRYACGAFWAAVSFADVPLPAPLDHPGAVKGFLLRHLRWWAKQPGIFNTDGTHNIGYAYPNMYMAENYNSPQSVYWCLKSFIALHLPEHHPFWAAPELPHPLSRSASLDRPLRAVSTVWPPHHILCNTREHHFLLSAGQSTRRDHKAREAKYGKFAYSSAFGFSVPSGPLLGQLAPDSTLCLSRDGGESWKVAWEPYDVRLETFAFGDERLPALVSRWRPWRDVKLHVETTLVSPSMRWTGWHFRVHRILWHPASLAASDVRSLECIDAGFSISAQQGDDSIFERGCCEMSAFTNAERSRSGWWKGGESALVMSEAGASGAAAMAVKILGSQSTTSGQGCGQTSRATILRPDANTNIISPRTLLPCVRHSFDFCSDQCRAETAEGNMETAFALGVFGIAASSEVGEECQRAAWINKPRDIVFLAERVLDIC